MALHNDDDDLWFCDDEDDDSDEDAIPFLLLLRAAATKSKNSAPRAFFYVRDRLEWETHVAGLLLEAGAFLRLYRMQHSSFLKLCSLLDPFLTTNEKMSKLRTEGKGLITTEIILHCLLRYLSGGSHLDIRLSAGISVPTFYVCIHKSMQAVLLCDELSYSFPATDDEICDAASEFRKLSGHHIIDGCVAAIDGYLLQIQTPSSSETGHVKAFFSGHYQAYGINVQAACDARCRFVYAALAAPGGANDIAAYRKTSLAGYVESLPLGKYVIGDNAYVATEHLLTPFPGDQKNEPTKDAYNFYLSQLRIRVEITFGRFVNKWRIFRGPLQVGLKNAGRLYMCATRLHNFCINEAAGDDRSENPSSAGDNATFFPSNYEVAPVLGNSTMRDILLEEIKERAIVRPTYNLERNNNRD